MAQRSFEKPDGSVAASARLEAFFGHLSDRYRARLAAWEPARARISTLAIARAALRAAEVSAAGQGPFQLAVIGPTQVGKSTIVNELLGVEVAQPSPLAGFTVQAHAFDTQGGNLARVRSLFPHRLVQTAVESGRESAPDSNKGRATVVGTERGPVSAPDAVVYSEVAGAHLLDGDGAIVWDTPDFDSVASGPYRDAALETLAIADAVLLVLSKEKYADLTVWNVLSMIAPLGQPLLVCLNKMTPDAEPAIRRSLLARLASEGVSLDTACLLSVPAFAYGRAESADERAAVQALRGGVSSVAGTARSASQRRSGAVDFMRAYWPEWIEPIIAEHAAADDWSDKSAAAVTEAAETYEREFLDHPQRYDTFRRATAELLSLLEVPGIGGALAGVRAIVTYPARRLLAAGRSLLGRAAASSGAMVHGEGSEQTVLFEIADHLLAGAARDAARRASSGGAAASLWRALAYALEEREDALRSQLREAARKSCRNFEPEIQAAADKLYEQLRTRPALLNALRATRASTDLAGVALAINSGGAALDDLLFAPAMFAVTSMLTEGALGSYMRGVAADLKARRKAEVNEKLFQSVFADALRGLLDELDGENLFAVEPEQLERARAAIDALSENRGHL